MADAVAIGFQFLFRKPGYRVVELTEFAVLLCIHTPHGSHNIQLDEN